MNVYTYYAHTTAGNKKMMTKIVITILIKENWSSFLLHLNKVNDSKGKYREKKMI